jgi:hypothetical protein
MVIPPILDNKHTSSPSVFVPSVLLREARRQKNIAVVQVPSACILDPDGDLVRSLRSAGKATPFPGWPCYHTDLDTIVLAGQEIGIVGRVVGASFAVKPGAHVVIGTFAPDGPERCSGLPIVRHDAISLSKILGGEFVLMDTRRHDHVTPWGAVQRFQFSSFRRI